MLSTYVICDNCFDEFDDKYSMCPGCREDIIPKGCKIYADSELTSHIFKCMSSVGFKNQEQIEAYQIVKHDHKILTGNDLTKLDEKVNK